MELTGALSLAKKGLYREAARRLALSGTLSAAVGGAGALPAGVSVLRQQHKEC